MSYSTIVTPAGRAKIAAYVAGGPATFDAAQALIGDGGGAEYELDPGQTTIRSQVYSVAVNSIRSVASDPTRVEVIVVIPVEAGPFQVREVAITDAAGVVLAIAALATQPKPAPSAGQPVTMTIKLILDVQNAAAVTLAYDDSLVYPTKEYVDEQDAAMLERVQGSIFPDPDTIAQRLGDGSMRAASDASGDPDGVVNHADLNAALAGFSGGAPLGSTVPLVDGTASAGNAGTAARSNHVHPTDTSRAAVGSMVPLADGTPSAGSSALAARADHVHPASNAFGSTVPLMDGTATIGVSVGASHADHVHPTDTSRAAVGSVLPAMDGVAANAGVSPLAARADHVHPHDSTIPLIGSLTPLVDGTANAGTSGSAARADHVHPTDLSRAAVGSSVPLIAGAAAAGMATTAARSDHVHPSELLVARSGSSGSVKFPSGLIFAWGQVSGSVADANGVVSGPVGLFPSSCSLAIPTSGTANVITSLNAIGASTFSTINYKMNAGSISIAANTAVSFSWIAIGY